MAERLERWTCYSEAPSSNPALTASWICSRLSRVQILRPTCHETVANWFASGRLGFLTLSSLIYILFVSGICLAPQASLL